MSAYNRWGKHILFSFLNLDYAEKNEKKHFKFIFFILFSVVQVQKIFNKLAVSIVYALDIF